MSLYIQFCLNKPGYTSSLFTRSCLNHLYHSGQILGSLGNLANKINLEKLIQFGCGDLNCPNVMETNPNKIRQMMATILLVLRIIVLISSCLITTNITNQLEGDCNSYQFAMK